MNLEKISVERLIKIILEKNSALSREKLLQLIEEKIAQLGGIIDREGAAILVAKELGVSIPREEILLNTSKLEIIDLVPGLNNISLIARIAKIQGPYLTSSGRKLAILEIYDKTRSIILKIWDDAIKELLNADLRPGDCVLVEGAYSKRFQGNLELGISSRGKIRKINLETCKEIPDIEYLAKKRDDIILGVIIEQTKSLSSKHTCIFGFIDDIPFVGHLPENSSLPTPPQKVIIQDARVINTKPAYYLKFTQNSKIYPLGNPEENLLKKLTHKLNAIFLRGTYLGYELSKQRGGKIYLYHNDNVDRILVFNDYMLLPFSEKSPLSTLSIGPCYKTNNSKKLRDCFKVSFSNESQYKDEVTESKYLYNAKYVENIEVVVTSARIRLRTIDNKYLLSLRLKVEEGSSFGILISNQRRHLESIFNQKIDAFNDLSENIRDEILGYLEHESLGKRLIISGHVFKKIIVPTQISPIDNFA